MLNEADVFADLPDISEVKEFDPNGKHREIAKDFQKFLDKWDAWEWLGLSVLHSHRKEGFVVGEDETLIENTDPVARMQTLTPTKLTAVNEGQAINTNFRFFRKAFGDVIAGCRTKCMRDTDGSHARVHLIGVTAQAPIAGCEQRCVFYGDDGKGHVQEHVKT